MAPVVALLLIAGPGTGCRSPEQATRRDPVVQEANRRFEQGKLAEAITLYEKRLRAGDDPEARAGLVRTLLAAGECARGRAEASRALDAHPDDPTLDLLAMLAALCEGDAAQARTLALQQAEAAVKARTQAKAGETGGATPLPTGQDYASALVLATTADSKAEYAQAEQALTALRSPESVEHHIALARVAQGLGEPRAAQGQRDAAAKAERVDLPLAIAMGRGLIASGQPTLGAALLQETARLVPGHPRLDFSLAEVALELRDIGLAAQALSRLPQADPTGAVTAMRVQVALARGDARAARTWLERASEVKDPAQLRQLRLLEARVLAMDGDTEASNAVLAALAAEKPEDTRTRLLWIERLIASGQFEQARGALDALAREQPELSRVQFWNARWLEAQAKYAAAAKAYRPYVTAEPDDALGHYHLGLSLSRAGDAKAALPVLQRAVELDASNEAVVRAWLDVSTKVEGNEAALEALAAFAHEHRADAAPQLVLGQAQMQAGEPAQAARAFAAAVEADPTSARAHVEGARAMLARHHRDDAVQLLHAGLAIARPKYLLHAVLADIYQGRGDAAAAIHEYEAVLQERPDAAAALNNLAYLLLEGDDAPQWPRALALAERAHALEPNDPGILDTVGWAQHKLGRHDEAIASLREAIALDAQIADLHYHLGLVQRARGDTAASDATLRHALALGKPFAGAAHARHLLAPPEANP